MIEYNSGVFGSVKEIVCWERVNLNRGNCNLPSIIIVYGAVKKK